MLLFILLLGTALWMRQRPDNDANGRIGGLRADPPPVVEPFRGAIEPPSLEQERHVDASLGPAAAAVGLGSITVADELGIEHSTESGHLVLASLGETGKQVALITLPVISGRWDPSATPARDFSVHSIQLGGRRAILVGDTPPMLRGRAPQALQARWLATASIRVVDDSSGAELDAVTLYWMDTLSSAEVEIPLGVRGAHLIGEGMNSPITLDPLPEQSMTATLFAYRPGYAWGTLAFDRFGGGDQTLRLRPGGDLVVSIGGADPTSDMTVRLWRGSRVEQRILAERALSRLPRDSRSIALPGLAIGSYEITLERGDRSVAVPLDLASIRIERAGTAPAYLTIPSNEGDASTSVRLRVRIDPTWDLTSFSLTMKDLDLPGNQPGQKKNFRSSGMTRVESFTWESNIFQARSGRHEVFLREARLGVECFVPVSDEVQIVTLDVPACGIVGITVIDAHTGQLVEHPSICWSALNNAGRPSGTGCESVPASNVGRLEFRAPVGKAELNVTAGPLDPYLGDFRNVDITPGMQELIVELQPAAVISLELREGDRRVEWSPDVSAKIVFRRQAQTVRPSRTAVDSQRGFLTCFLTEPGGYTVVLPKIPGYMAPPDFEIDVVFGEPIHRIVEITRQQ